MFLQEFLVLKTHQSTVFTLNLAPSCFNLCIAISRYNPNNADIDMAPRFNKEASVQRVRKWEASQIQPLGSLVGIGLIRKVRQELNVPVRLTAHLKEQVPPAGLGGASGAGQDFAIRQPDFLLREIFTTDFNDTNGHFWRELVKLRKQSPEGSLFELVIEKGAGLLVSFITANLGMRRESLVGRETEVFEMELMIAIVLNLYIQKTSQIGDPNFHVGVLPGVSSE